MAYNFLTLTNNVCNRINETPLTSSNFASQGGLYDTIKEAINSSIRHINQEDFVWPFNHNLETQTLTAGTLRYSYPADAKFVDFNTFRIQRNSGFGNETIHLTVLDYEEYLQKASDDEYNTSDTSIRETPRYVARTPSLEYIVYPAPDQAYELDFEYYSLPTDLVDYDDVPSVPVQFRHIIVNGAMMYLYQFQSDYENFDRIKPTFLDDIKNMKAIYINRYEYMRDTMIIQRGTSGVRTI